LLHPLDGRACRGYHQPLHGLATVNAERSENVVVQHFKTATELPVPQFPVQYLGEDLCHRLVSVFTTCETRLLEENRVTLANSKAKARSPSADWGRLETIPKA
jgi:hypothetical protein